MNRRHFLVTAAGSALLAGCSALEDPDAEAERPPFQVDDRESATDEDADADAGKSAFPFDEPSTVDFETARSPPPSSAVASRPTTASRLASSSPSRRLRTRPRRSFRPSGTIGRTNRRSSPPVADPRRPDDGTNRGQRLRLSRARGGPSTRRDGTGLLPRRRRPVATRARRRRLVPRPAHARRRARGRRRVLPAGTPPPRQATDRS